MISAIRSKLAGRGRGAVSAAFILCAALFIFSPLAASAAVTAVIKTDGFGLTGMAPFSKSFTAASSTGSDGLTTSIVRQEWDFADDNSAHGFPRYMHGNMANHRWESAGSYAVTLTVYDSSGASGSATALISVSSIPASAVTYYIDAVAGNDNNTGTSTVQAWKSIDKLTRMYPTFNGGDSILFKAGQTFDTWSNKSAVFYQATGSATASPGVWALTYRDSYNGYNNSDTLLRSAPYFIRLGSYGSGAKPIIVSASSTAETTSTATVMVLDSSGVNNGKGIIIDGLDIRGTVWIDSYANGSGTGDVPGLMSVLRNSRIGTYNGAGHYIQFAGTGIIENSDIDLSGIADVSVVGIGTASNPAFFTVASSTVRNSKNHCIYLSGSSISSLIINSSIHDCGSATRDFDGITAHGVQNDLNIVNNDIYNAYFCMGLDANEAPRPEYLTGVVVDRNKCHNLTSHVFQFRSVKNLSITNNLVYDISGSDQPIFWFEGNGALQDSSNIKIYHNTLAASSAGIFNIDYAPGAYNTADIHFKNNIVTTTPSVKLMTDSRPFLGFATSSKFESDYNAYYGVNGGTQLSLGAYSYNLSQWLAQAEPHSSNGVNPQFNNYAGFDYSLKKASPLAAAGANLKVYYDRDLAVRSAASPSLGAYEYFDSGAPLNIGISAVSADSVSRLTVTALTVADGGTGLSATPYWFRESSGHSGAISSSVWQASTVFINSGLAPNTAYSYQVKARNASNVESAYSAAVTKFTLASPPASFGGSASANSASLSVAALPNQSAGLSGYLFSRSGANSGWQQSNVWADRGLSCATAYDYSVSYRNGDGVQTIAATTTLITAACPAVSGGGGGGGGSPAAATVENYISTAATSSGATSSLAAIAVSGKPPFSGLMRYAGTPKVYLVKDGVKRWIKTEQAFRALGYDFSNVEVMPTEQTFADGADITDAPAVLASAEPAIIRYEGSPKVYLAKNGVQRWITTRSVFYSLGFNDDDIMTLASSSSYADGGDLTSDIAATAFISADLRGGAAGPQVKLLQQKLNSLGFYVAVSGAGSLGRETLRFGPATKAAVTKLQKRFNLLQDGIVQGATRSQINKLIAN